MEVERDWLFTQGYTPIGYFSPFGAIFFYLFIFFLCLVLNIELKISYLLSVGPSIPLLSWTLRPSHLYFLKTIFSEHQYVIISFSVLLPFHVIMRKLRSSGLRGLLLVRSRV